jgi:hypothetical protein
MKPHQLAAVPILLIYAAVPLVAALLASRTTRSFENLVLDVALSTVPMLMLAAIGWRLVWPRWKLFAKILIHPCIYLILSIYIHHWSILLAWLHQGVLGLGGHIWFSRKHGFKWYAVEDVERYIDLSKRAVGVLSEPKE